MSRRLPCVQVRLDAADGRLDLEVYDDGCGISPQDMGKPDSFGLRGMRERAFSLGGALRISSGSGRGTLIALWLPLTTAPNAPEPMVTNRK